MPVAVSDSSTLIHLAAIDRLPLLREFYSKVLVPQAVWSEVVEEGEARAGATEVANAREAGWIEVVSVQDHAVLRLLKHDLGPGEAETIALAAEGRADIALLDETEGRRIADVLGVRKTGAVGLLIRAVLEGSIEKLLPELGRLRDDAGFWISDELYSRALGAVGEKVDT